MKIVTRKHIDEKRWAEWSMGATEIQPFLHLDYLDAVSKELCFVLNADETGGMALPYFEKFGVKTLYTPVFFRWTNWIGENAPKADELNRFLMNEFQQADLYMFSESIGDCTEKLIYQNVKETSYKLNSQAKRKIKSVAKSEIKISDSPAIKEGLNLLREELSNRFATLEESDFDSLEVLLGNLHKNNILCQLSLLDKNNLVGTLFLVQTEKSILYLKGTCNTEWKKNGGMYALMNQAILSAFEKKKVFDFGGSRIDGVRRFNKCFGGQDMEYFRYEWSNGPWWYNQLKRIKNAWRKK